MEIKTEPTFTADIYLAGDLAVIEQRCREFCLRVGLCVTVSPTRFVYTGGQEDGARVGLVNYPRFPKGADEVSELAKLLALELIDAACQHSALVVRPDQTVWVSRRDECPAAK